MRRRLRKILISELLQNVTAQIFSLNDFRENKNKMASMVYTQTKQTNTHTHTHTLSFVFVFVYMSACNMNTDFSVSGNVL